MAKKRKVARKSKASKVVDPKARVKDREKFRTDKRKRDEHEKLSLAHGVISGAYANLVEQFHPTGYDEQRLAKKGKAKTKKKVARKAKAKKKAAAPKRKVKTRRKK